MKMKIVASNRIKLGIFCLWDFTGRHSRVANLKTDFFIRLTLGLKSSQEDCFENKSPVLLGV